MCICEVKAMLDELDHVLLLDSPSQQLLSYDPTFQLGDFQISVLASRHALFSKPSVIPAAFLIHERKLQTIHKEFFVTCTKLCKSLGSTNFPIVTDEEKGIVNAISAIILGASHIRCWNHLFKVVPR